ncbi:MAG: hypothetical protein AB7V13_08355 [Pseudorhodoplanes sp.]|uniref:hypothetical protein n=1 Tax=Pseudorhodoplanes sp. TaxID=1934341 RepID=UPI003D10C7D3
MKDYVTFDPVARKVLGTGICQDDAVALQVIEPGHVARELVRPLRPQDLTIDEAGVVRDATGARATVE